MGTFIQNKEELITSEKDSKTELNIFTCGNSKEIRVGNRMEQDLDLSMVEAALGNSIILRVDKTLDFVKKK